MKCSYCHKNFLKYNGIISGEKMFCSSKCYKDEKNSIKEIEGAEEYDEDNENNENEHNINNIKNNGEDNNNDIEDDPVFSNDIDILDI